MVPGAPSVNPAVAISAAIGVANKALMGFSRKVLMVAVRFIVIKSQSLKATFYTT